jgi:Prohead core protein serine protease
MSLKLITEIYQEPMSLITEADNTGKKFLYIQGPMAVSEVKNKNGRIYAKSLLEKVVDKYYNEYIKTSRALGEMNHPSRLSVDFERATHLITELKQDGNVWIGKAKVLKTPMGKILEGLIESGVSVGVSTRGAGSIIESNGVKTVGDDFMMTAIDVVSDPSGQMANGAGCFVQGILEGVSFSMDDRGMFIQQDITELAKIDYDKKRLTEQRKLELFNKFIESIKGF